MKNVLLTLRNEPVLVSSGVVALLGVATAFGLTVNNDQQSAIVALVGSVVQLAGAAVSRSKVTPVAKGSLDRAA